MAKYLPQSVFDHAKFRECLDYLNLVTNLIVQEDSKEARHRIAEKLLISAVFEAVSVVSQLTAKAPKKEVKEWLEEHEDDSEDE